MSYWLDVLIIALMIAFGMRGYTVGFSKSMLSIARLVISLLFGLFFTGRLTRFFEANSSVPEKISGFLISVFKGRYGSDVFVKPLTDVIMTILSFAVIYFTLWLVFQILILFFDRLNSLPGLKQFNLGGGLLLGLLKGFFVAVIVSNVIYLLGSLGVIACETMSKGSKLLPYMKLSVLYNWFMNGITGS